ncbi:ubiquinone biosynthesis protein COQ9, mitochondrial-like isoform X2 [Babylonia areolata]|uniref:ubiquinone biosynthesis protein COQ9, mitochondrial-like isoform X2 n=1 Tax=Babylonia areolata TaxID=304850 RepID=UPI003FD0508C
MATQMIVCLRRLSNNGVRQLWQGQVRCFSKTHGLSAAGEGDTTSQSSQGSAEEESSYQCDADAVEQEEYDTRQRILQASLPFVHQHGWTRKALAAGAETEGYPTISHGMFPRGGAELVHFFYATCNKDLAVILAERVQQQGEEKPRTREFIRDALETRLRMIVPYLDTWPQAMAIQALPQNALQSWTNLRNLVDDVWYYAGDRSVDFDWYTKRASLAGVYKATEIYLLQDRSEDNANTWAFMDRRLQDVQTVGKAARSASQMGSAMSEGVWGMCIMGRNILGMNPRNR